ncbi:L-threonine 3-dehydrogenase [Stieleria maiorica]|uniref:L-threonine 3-dehydrogenase n=1 Tax=Stieleria maiorica TaxID=2795974 RepID=A0A5B9MNI8_9BACT|nr:alcohol dehydrogenase catalytic domain-containing protein [Stieleria maiorica]QEG00428.1 L-threonine 3-dehydrogenase [Stieleria maiorica]
MQALVRTDEGTEWRDVAAVTPGVGQVLVQVSLVGLCRTDLAVASGRLRVDTPRILGHEFVGRVVAVGEDVCGLSLGDKVAADPVLHCGRCDRCAGGWQHACRRARFLGVDVDGAIVQQIAIPAPNAWRLPASLDDRIAALLEPVAACAAVLKTPIDVSQRGVVFGRGRLASLTKMILQSRGFLHVHCVHRGAEPMESDQYDFAIDTEGTTRSVGQLADSLRPAGVLVLKSRPLRPVELQLRTLLPKEPQVVLVNYADFADARELLLDPAIDFASLLGPVWSAERSARAFEAAALDPFRKHFVDLTSFPAQNSVARSQHQCVPSSDV